MSSNSSDDSVENSIKFDKNFIIKLTNENNNIIERSTKQNCKILKISSELDIDQKLAITSALEPSEYPNLFIFIIEHQNGKFLTENQGIKSQQFDEHLKKFGAARPLIIQQRLIAENETKLYYKSENSSQVVDIDQNYAEDYELYDDWKNKLSSLLDQELSHMLKKLSCIKKNSIILRFLRTLNIQEAFFGSMVLEIAKTGSKADFLAVLDASFEDSGRMLNSQAQNYIKNVFEDDESGSESDEVESTSEKSSDDDHDNPTDQTSTESIKKEDSSQSVLLTAVQHSNQEIIDYLITYCSHLIQQLPVEHQIRISTAAYDTSQHDVLCDLLDIADFPFPENFTFSKSKNDEKLLKITEDRMEFKAAIEREDYEKIDGFVERNLNNKYIYSINNNSALTEAVDARQYGVFYYLKSLGFQGETCQDILDELNQEERKQAVNKATEQIGTNIDKSLRDFHKSVLHLSARSLIHNRKISKEKQVEYRRKIRSWLKDIQKIAPEMLDVAASCEDLKIIYDFESDSVSLFLRIKS